MCLRLRHPTGSIVPDPRQADNVLLLPSGARNLVERPVPVAHGPSETGPWAAGSSNLPIGTVGRTRATLVSDRNRVGMTQWPLNPPSPHFWRYKGGRELRIRAFSAMMYADFDPLQRQLGTVTESRR